MLMSFTSFSFGRHDHLTMIVISHSGPNDAIHVIPCLCVPFCLCNIVFCQLNTREAKVEHGSCTQVYLTGTGPASWMFLFLIKYKSPLCARLVF